MMNFYRRYKLVAFLVPLLSFPALTSLPGHAATAPAAQNQGAEQATVNINLADTKTLEGLPGVGPVLAQRIIAGRPYRGLLDLEKVKGLGKSKVEAFRNRIVFGPVAAVPRQPAAAPTAPGKAAAAPQNRALAASSLTARTNNLSRATASKPKLAPGEKININTATPEQLERLPGIGPTKANAIAAHRAQNGNFKTVEDIQKVKGIKAGSFSRIKDSIKVTD